MNVFNRHVKRLQRDRAAADPESQDYDYLRKEIAARLADRLNVRYLLLLLLLSSLCTSAAANRAVAQQDVLEREFPSVLALGGAAAGVAEHLQEIPGVKRIVQLDSSRTPICPARTHARHRQHLITHYFARPYSAQSCSRPALGRRSCECVAFQVL